MATPAGAESLRIATYAPDLTRKGPGLLLQALEGDKDPQIAAVVEVIDEAAPDVLLLTGIDWDYDGMALSALRERLEEAGQSYPYSFALQPNTGLATGLDLDGNGRLGEPRDAQGFGQFTGAEGMALLSRLPILEGESRDYTGFLWRDLPDSLIAEAGLSAEVAAIQRLSSAAHWDIALRTAGDLRLHLLAWSATPPVFDGPEDRNGRRNRDEAAFWLRYLDGRLPMQPLTAPFVLIGNANLDPFDGEGRRDALAALLADPRLQDPQPSSDAARAAADSGHRGDPALDTVDYSDPPGNLRLDYVLPSADLRVVDAGVAWGGPAAAAASRHRLVWVDITLP